MDFAARRAALLRQLGGGVVILTAAPAVIRSHDSHFPYRQDNDFYYLTGFTEPRAVAVLSAIEGQPPLTLFVRSRDPERETWDGPRAGVDGVIERFGATAAYPIDDLATRLPALVSAADQVAYTPSRDGELHDTIDAVLRAAARGRMRTGRGPRAIADAAGAIHELRLFKDEPELVAMRCAADITAAAHAEVMRVAAPGVWEYEAEAAFHYTVRRLGAMGPAYPSIIASGANACTLHYVTNDCQMRDGDLLLIDAGAEFDHYACDVTRTFPVNGVFSPAQREVYEIVLRAQFAGIDRVRVGCHFKDAHIAALRVICEGLVSLGVLTGEVDAIIEEQTFKPFYMHSTGHWLGLDVHDMGQMMVEGVPRALEPGMVMTVEPGLYFALRHANVPERLRGIGVRIEDDVAVTAGEPEVLTAAIPKSVDAVEAAWAALHRTPVGAGAA